MANWHHIRVTQSRFFLIWKMSLAIAVRRSVLLFVAATSVTAQHNSDLDRYSDQARQALAAKQWHEAAAALQHLAQLAPAVAQVQANLGLALFFDGRAEEALSAFEHARKLNPTLPQVEVMGAICKAELGRYVEAIALLAPAFERTQDE